VTVSFDVCQPGDVDELVALLADVFTAGDPPAAAVGLEPSEFAALVELYRVRAGTQGLTVVARSTRTREIVGVILGEDAAAPFPEGVERLSRKFDPIFDILSQLDLEHRSARQVLPGDALHLFLLGVRATATGHGIAQRLVQESLVLGAKAGYRTAITEATNVVSRHVFLKLGFVEMVRRSYLDFRFGGRAVFAPIADHDGPVLLERRI
jgi:ribosomal protein S18 acetylase RimI-like enzyme